MVIYDIKSPSLILAQVQYEPGHISYRTLCTSSEESDQPAHERRLIRVIAARLKGLDPMQPTGCPAKTGQAARMRRLILVLAGSTCRLVWNVVPRLSYVKQKNALMHEYLLSFLKIEVTVHRVILYDSIQMTIERHCYERLKIYRTFFLFHSLSVYEHNCKTSLVL